VLTNKREALYKECIPILRDFLKVSENNNEAIRTLKNIYGTIGDNEGFMEMKRLLDAQE
jgi:vacuolar-type H+-ATPase subunit D/Vma8